MFSTERIMIYLLTLSGLINIERTRYDLNLIFEIGQLCNILLNTPMIYKCIANTAQ